MANCFIFTDKTVSESGSLTWSNQAAVTTSFNPSSSNGDCSMTDSINDSYATAIDENETQYLSVLETTNDVTLEDLQNLTIGNPKLMEQENSQSESAVDEDKNLTDIDDQQVVIFNMEGSDDLFGIQIAQDEEGNLQKYQFQVRTNMEGQYEAILDTIQLLPDEKNNPEEQKEISIEHESVEDNGSLGEVYETQVYMHEELDGSTDNQIYIQNSENINSQIYVQNTETTTEETEMEQQLDESSKTVLVLVKPEPTTSINQAVGENETELGEQVFDHENDECDEQHEAVDVKPSFIEVSLMSDIKEEYHNMKDQISKEVECQRHGAGLFYGASDLPGEHNQEIVSQEYHTEDSYYTVVTEEETVLDYEHFDSPNIEEICVVEAASGICEQMREPSEEEHLHTGHFIDEERMSGNREVQHADMEEEVGEDAVGEHYFSENDSESEGYDMGNAELHVTAEGDISDDSSSPEYHTVDTMCPDTEELHEEETIPLKQQIDYSPTNVLKQPMNSNNMDNFDNKTILYYMVTSAEQKENVISMPLNNTLLAIKPNPRSLLKNVAETGHAADEPLRAKDNSNDPKKSPSQRRFARSSEFAQAKLFNNFINKTTIPQAPIRQIRLPRKQEIKPVDTRRNEEIIVKEVMVSSKGFVENVNDRLNSKDKLEVTSFVELSDSEDDEREHSRNGAKAKKKQHRRSGRYVTHRQGDTTVIEILQSDEEAEAETKRGPGRPRKSESVVVDGSKRPRGRPPKAPADSPHKKSRTESSDSDQGKTEISCPHCPKSFPSQNSLNTHIHHHNLENRLRNAKTQPVEYKHKCDSCQSTFKNSILLKKHVCQKTNHKPKCAVCSKTFDDTALLNIHKRTHLKENLVKNTTTVTVSPKKFKLRPSTIHKFKSPKEVAAFKCKHCPKVCSSQVILTAHEKTHKNFSCLRCKATFSSLLLLDTHLRISCVKTASPKDKRLSFKIRKSFVNSPRRGRLSAVAGKPNRSGRRLSVAPKKPSRTSEVPSRTSAAPIKPPVRPSRVMDVSGRSTGLASRTTTIPNRTSVVPSRTPVVPSRTSIVPNRTQAVQSNTSDIPGKTLGLASTTSKVPSKSAPVPGSLLTVPSKASSVLEKHSVTPNNASGVYVKPIDLKLQCATCQMKFSTMTALFKHEVKEHNFSTPDKKVLLPDKKQIHKPLHEHGGIPMPCRLNKVFQGFRKKLESDSSADTTTVDKSDGK